MNNRCLKHVVSPFWWHGGRSRVSDREPSRELEVRCRFAALSLDSPPPSLRYHSPALSRLSFFHFTSLGQISRSASRPRHRPPAATGFSFRNRTSLPPYSFWDVYGELKTIPTRGTLLPPCGVHFLSTIFICTIVLIIDLFS